MRLTVVLFTAACLLFAATVPASGKIVITRINFDPKGRHTGNNGHLNREYVSIWNSGERARRLRGWKIHDRGRDHVYRFRRLTLQPGDTVTLHTGNGDDGAAVADCAAAPCPTYYYLYWDLDEYVWDNRGDTATLRNRDGKIVDRCRYGVAARRAKSC